MAIILNEQGNCSTDSLGTGLGDCVKQYGDLVGVDAYRKGYSLNTTTDSLPSEAEYKELIQGLQLYPLNNLYTFDQLTPENERATGSTGLLTTIRDGKPQFSFTFDKGGCWGESLYGMKGKNRWDLAFKFETGVLYARDVDGEVLKPFNNGLFDPETFKILQGTDPEMSMVMVQFNNAIEWNSRKVFYTWDALGYDMNSIEGVINTVGAFSTTPVAGTSFEVVIKDACNQSVNILGLDDVNNWGVLGTQATPASVSAVVANASTGGYTITIDNAAISTDSIGFTLADVSNGYIVAENSSGDLFKGVTPIVTIA